MNHPAWKGDEGSLCFEYDIIKQKGGWEGCFRQREIA